MNDELSVTEPDSLDELKTFIVNDYNPMCTALSKAAKYIADKTGSCPHDAFDWDHPACCSQACINEVPASCWRRYFLAEAGGDV